MSMACTYLSSVNMKHKHSRSSEVVLFSYLTQRLTAAAGGGVQDTIYAGLSTMIYYDNWSGMDGDG